MNRNRLLSLGLLVVFLALSAGCDNTSKDFDGDPASKAPVKTGVKPEPDAQVAVIETADYGRIVIELYPNIAPKMVEQFKKLITDHEYDGTAIHRIDPRLGIIQGGDPLTKNGNPALWGTGNSKLPNVPAEFSDILYERGTVGAARQGKSQMVTERQAADTANCQWFITLKSQPAFNREYTVFGRVIDGITNAEVIMNAPTESGSERPADKVVIKSVTLQPRASFPAS